MSSTMKRIRAIRNLVASMGFEVVNERQKKHIVLELRHEKISGTRTLSMSASPKNGDHQIAQVRKDLEKFIQNP